MNLQQLPPPQTSWFDLTKDRNKFILFFFYSFFLLFFLSPDSYLYDVAFHGDSATFYASGKAWMNGMVPYVDFADSKGPLLWLIYGIGYLLNSHSYVGVFWISCVFYAVSFTFAYKISRLYLDRRTSVLVLALLPSFLFLKGFEVKAEDFCNTFIFVSLYCLCKVQTGVNKPQMFKYAFTVGVCMTCCLFIKWNYFFMLGGIALVVLFLSVSRTKTLTGLWGGLLGIIVTAIPFLINFAIQGNFSAFISEYFLNTAETIENIHGGKHLKPFMRGLICGFKADKFLIFSGIYLFCRLYKKTWGILFSIVVFYVLLAPSPISHYYVVLLPFGIFFLIAVGTFVNNTQLLSGRISKALCAVCVLCSMTITMNYAERWTKCVLFDKDENRQQYYDVSQLMATVKKPKVMFFSTDLGTGVLVESLPACRYWISQFGATTSMHSERKRDLLERKADFLFVPNIFGGSPVDLKFSGLTLDLLKRLGYRYCGDMRADDSFRLSVYCKKELYRKLPPVKFNKWDLLLKRNLLCKDED